MLSEWGRGFVIGMGVGVFACFYGLMSVVTMWTVLKDEPEVDSAEDK